MIELMVDVRYLEPIAMVCLCVCFMDGVISEEEEEALFFELSEYFSIGKAEFEDLVNKFFESNVKLKTAAEKISENEIRKLALNIAKVSAEADGLDSRENIAWQKIQKIWGLEK